MSEERVPWAPGNPDGHALIDRCDEHLAICAAIDFTSGDVWLTSWIRLSHPTTNSVRWTRASDEMTLNFHQMNKLWNMFAEACVNHDRRLRDEGRP